MVPFPAQPAGVPWPAAEWPEAELAADVDREAVETVLADIFGTPPELGVSLATVVVHRGAIVAERYAADVDRDSTLISWSMAKSMTQAVIGVLVGDGLLDIDAPLGPLVPEFAGTEKASITVRDLLAMKSGLEFNEDYVGGTGPDVPVSHCLEMLFGAGVDDHANYAASQQLLHPPGTVWSYSSGTTNILSRLAALCVASGFDLASGTTEPAMRELLDARLFGPIGMTTAAPKFDAAGTFVGSSYVFATARDFARFGLLYLRDGVWDRHRLLPEGWADYARAEVAVDEDPPHFGYGAHWWIWRDQPGSLAAHGYEGQYVIVLPERDLVVVHLAKIPADVRAPLFPKLDRLINAFPT
ncbi:MAG: beta-lactamase [Ilumatobacteraceae bacterium]|nr:beta-lactamase [Ilumatobacteraceae bacterium]